MTVTAKAKTKFSSRNLNAVYKAPLAKAADNAGYHSGSRMLVLRSSNSMGGRSSILAAKSLAVAAPAPINTPSLRKENNGQDVHVNLVPTGKVGWGTSPRANDHKNSNNVEEPEPRATGNTGAEHSTASYSSRSESSSRQVWAGGLVSSSQRQGEPVQHHSDCNSRTAFSAQSGPNRGKLFSGASSTGRWGDDAVEQDIARSDMMRAMQKERDFPQLKENFANDVHHFHASDDQRFSDNNSSSSSNNNSYGYEQRHHRYGSYEFERRGGGNSFHEDRFSSRGDGGFDRTRGPPPNSYGNNHGYYYPSDSRYDNYEHASSHQPIASSSYHHQHPGSNDRYYDSYRREHSHPNGHPGNGYNGEDHHDGSRFQARPYQIERHGCDSIPEPHGSSVMPSRSDTDNQSPVSGLDNQKSVPWSLSEPVVQQQLPSDRNALHDNISDPRILEPQVKDDRGNDKGATPQSVSTSVWKKVDADIAQNCSSGVRRQVSEYQPPMKSSSVHQPFAGGRPFLVRDGMSASSSSYRPSHVATSAQSNPTVGPVRILKRDGPKMLFDPKTGTMVNAEEKSSSHNQRLPSAAASSSSTVASSETETSGSSPNSVPTPELKPNTKSSTGGVTKRISHAKPDQIWKRSSSEEKASVSPKPENEETEPAPETTVPSKSTEPQTPMHQLSSKPLRGKKAKASDSSTSKKAVVKSNTKKYVLAYRPVSKPGSDEAAATPVNAESAPAPLPMKKFNELFAPSKPIKLVEEPAEPAPSRAVKSTTVKHSKKQSVPSKFPKTVKSAHRENEIANEGRVRKSNSKAPKVFRKRLESPANCESSSTHSSNNSADILRIVIEPPPSTPSGREDTPRVRHSKIRKGIDVDILKQIPEGGGVVVLTDAQEGIEFLPDDSENKFETVRSRRALLLEKKQLREASAAVVQKRTPRTKRAHGVEQQITASGIVMAAPSRTAKRTLVVGTRANPGKPTAKLSKSSTSEFQPNHSPVKAKAESSESPPDSSNVQATKSEQTKKGNLRNRASSLPSHAQKLSAEHCKAQSDQSSTTKANASAKAKQNLKTPVKKRVYRELPPKKEDADPVKGNEVLAHLSSNPISATAAAGDCRPNGELKTRDASTHARKQGHKLVKSQKVNNTLQPTPVEVKNVEVLTETTGVHKEPTVASARPVRLDSDLSKSSKQSAARNVKSQRSSAAVVPVTMKYVPKVPVKAASTGESAKPEASKPEVIRLPEEAVIAKSAKTVDGGERRNSRKVKQTFKLSAAKATPPATAQVDPLPKTKPTQCKSVSSADPKFRAVAPTPDKIETAPGASPSQSRLTKDDEAPRKVSKTTPSKTSNGDVKPKSVERPAPLKKRLSKTRADLSTPLPAAKSYKQIYVVKSSSSTSNPAPSSSAA